MCGTRPPTNFSVPALSHLQLCTAADQASFITDCGLMVKVLKTFLDTLLQYSTYYGLQIGLTCLLKQLQ